MCRRTFFASPGALVRSSPPGWYRLDNRASGEDMNRRHFIAAGAGAAIASRWAAGQPLLPAGVASTASLGSASNKIEPSARTDTSRHRFGLNYTPSHNWWFCWNDWNSAPIKRDLDAIAALGADHLRI